MDRKTATAMLNNLDLIKAFANGQVIQHEAGSGWYDHPNPTFTDTPDSYRIKPRPIEGWVNVYENGSMGTVHVSKERARTLRDSDTVRTVLMREVEN